MQGVTFYISHNTEIDSPSPIRLCVSNVAILKVSRLLRIMRYTPVPAVGSDTCLEKSLSLYSSAKPAKSTATLTLNAITKISLPGGIFVPRRVKVELRPIIDGGFVL
jgi:hypothetical protein